MQCVHGQVLFLEAKLMIGGGQMIRKHYFENMLKNFSHDGGYRNPAIV